MPALASVPTRPEAGIRLDHDTPDLAAIYDRVGFRQYAHGRELVALLDLQPGQRVLDVGCGTGLLGAWVADRLGADGEVIGVDPLPLRVVIAARKHPRLRARLGRAEDLGEFEDGSFDAVYLNSVLHWVADQPRALAEARRVLKPGGRIAVNSADPTRPHDAYRLLGEVLDTLRLRGRSVGLGGHNHQVDAHTLAALLHGAGFDDIEVTPRTFTDVLADVDELVDWSRSSSFGNWLSELDDEDAARVRERLAAQLLPYRSEQGLTLQRHLVFARGARR